MPFSDLQVFNLTKLLYADIHQNFSQNHIGQKQALEQFQQNYIQPLYPIKKIHQGDQDQEPTEKPAQTQHQHTSHMKTKFSQYRHKYDQNIVEFSEQSQQSAQEESQDEESSAISYVSAVQKYSLKDLICKLRVGRFFCWKTTPPDAVYEDLGLGICLYLKFMKHLVYVLLLLTILSAISMSIFYSIADSNKYNPKLNYQKVLFSLGMGSLSLQGMKCIHENITQTQSSIEFDLTCPVGFVRVLGPVYTSSRFETLQTCKQDIMAFVEQTPSLYMTPGEYFHVTDCNETSSQTCTYNLTLANPNSNYEQVSVGYECINGQSTYGKSPITRSAALYIAVVFDLILVVSLLQFYWSEQSAEKKQEKWFKEKQILLNAFTLEVGSFSKRNFNQEFTQFIEDVQKQIKAADNLQVNLRKCIVQVRLPDNAEYDKDQAKRESTYHSLYKFMGEYFIEPQIDPNTFVSEQEFKQKMFKTQSAFKSYRRKLSELMKQYRIFQQLKGKNHDQQLKVYIVFLKPKYKRLVMQKTRVILGSDVLQTDKKDYEIVDPPAPALILWDNIGKNKLLRGIISWILSLLILLGTYVLTAYILSLQNQTTVGQYDFNIECQNVFPDEDYNLFNQQYYEQYKLSYTHCYCLTRSIIFSLNFEPVCSEWRDQYSLFLAIPVLYGLGLFVMNEIVSAIYRKLSAMEAHQYLTSELYSYIIKKTILETTDLALIIVLLSINFNKQSTTFDFLLIGSYDDVSADWHLEVGIIIIVNMFFNVFSPFIEGIFYLFEGLVTKVKLCFFHRRANYNKTKMNYIENYRENVFPVEERYASILAVLFICLALNCVYPIMTVIMMVTLGLYQAVDKFMIIKAYHKPLNFEGLLQKKIMKVFLIILLVHIVITAVFLTEPFLVVAGRVSNTASIVQEHGTNRIANMFQVGYVLPYMMLLVIIVVCVLIIFGSDEYFRTKPNARVRLGLGGIPFEENKFYNLLDAYELDRTIALKRREIQRNKILEKRYMKKLDKKEDEDEILKQSDSNKPMIPTKRRDLILNKSKPILSQISQYSYYRLLKKKLKQLSKQQQKLVKLAGMTAYEWQEDWIYFDEEVRLDYKIPEVDRYLNQLARDAQGRMNLIKSIIDMARQKRLGQAKNDEQRKEVQRQIQQQKHFQQIINNAISSDTNLSHINNTHGEQLTINADTQLPIQQLQKQIQQIQQQKKQKSFSKSIRHSSREVMLVGSNNINEVSPHQLERKRSSKDQDVMLSRKKSSRQESLAKVPEIIDANDENQIRIKLKKSRSKYEHSDEKQSSQGSRQRQFIEDEQSQSRQIAPVVDIKEMSIEESKVINTSEEQDNQNQQQLQEPEELKKPNDQPLSSQDLEIVIKADVKSKDTNNFQLNQFPSEKILIED